jgi:calcineurin-like phosphoesterase family protein/purple acid phosphatase-like protein
MHRVRRSVLLVPILLAISTVAPAIPATAHRAQLLRYPYLTDVVGANATLNWATDRSATTGYATYGLAGKEACTAHKASGSKTAITVGARREYQWKAKLTGLAADMRYCYRVFLGSTKVDLLGSDVSPEFLTQVPAGSSRPYSFAVIGDWGAVESGGDNLHQANLMGQIAASGARFLLGTGDTAYPDSSQTNYGDLVQKGAGTGAVFGPAFYKDVGKRIPMFNALGNHGLTATHLMLWPQAAAVATSGGRYRMETYCCTNGTRPRRYPSAWYAFDAGPARVYILDAAWGNSNVGSADLYRNDYDNHWTPWSPQYRWLEDDLAAHPSALKFAVLHFPFWSDNATESSDPWLQGPDRLEGLFNRYGVDLVFNGHAHIYQRNLRRGADGFVSYVSGGGGAKPQPIGGRGCSDLDAYGIGWSSSSNRGSACGMASVPDSISWVFHFLLVTVKGTRVTVAPTDSLGRTFDVQHYDL